MSARAVTAIATAALVALVSAGAAHAHVVVSPSFLTAGEVSTLELTVPNERKAPMNGFLVKAPPDFRVVAARPVDDWAGTSTDAEAIWHGGPLARRLQATFTIDVEAPAEPGSATFQMEQHYPDGGVVRWPVALTVVPAPDSPSENLGLALVVGLGGLLVLALLGVLLWRRATGSLQER
jgi:uncharacterized protein YcnI